MFDWLSKLCNCFKKNTPVDEDSRDISVTITEAPVEGPIYEAFEGSRHSTDSVASAFMGQGGCG